MALSIASISCLATSTCAITCMPRNAAVSCEGSNATSWLAHPHAVHPTRATARQSNANRKACPALQGHYLAKSASARGYDAAVNSQYYLVFVDVLSADTLLCHIRIPRHWQQQAPLAAPRCQQCTLTLLSHSGFAGSQVAQQAARPSLGPLLQLLALQQQCWACAKHSQNWTACPRSQHPLLGHRTERRPAQPA